MRYDPRLTMVHAIAQGLLTHHMATDRTPLVIRGGDRHDVIDTLRTVAAAAGYSTRHYQALPTTKDASDLPPRHVVAFAAGIDLATAEHVTELAQTMPDDAILVIILDAEDVGSMTALGRAMLASGAVQADPELEPHQMVPAARLA